MVLVDVVIPVVVVVLVVVEVVVVVVGAGAGIKAIETIKPVLTVPSELECARMLMVLEVETRTGGRVEPQYLLMETRVGRVAPLYTSTQSTQGEAERKEREGGEKFT